MSDLNSPEPPTDGADEFARKNREFHRDARSIKYFVILVLIAYFAFLGYTVWHPHGD